MDSFITHLQLQNPRSIYEPFLINENILPIPAVILLTVAGRGCILWCINIVILNVMIKSARKMTLGPRRSGSPLATSSFGFEQTNQPGNTILDVSISKYQHH